jgi:type I restriction enzyme S subunit
VDPPKHLKDVERSRVQRDDLLITIVGANTGDVCRVDFDATNYFVCQSVALMRPALPELAGYLAMYLGAPDGGRREMDKVIYGAGRPHLSFDQIESLPVPLPPSEEINEILRRVSDALAAYEDALAILNAETSDAARLKQSILKAAFEGRLVPQDPADEPASALLARAADYSGAQAKRGRRKAAGANDLAT